MFMDAFLCRCLRSRSRKSSPADGGSTGWVAVLALSLVAIRRKLSNLDEIEAQRLDLRQDAI
jgi:hypothetical protein